MHTFEHSTEVGLYNLEWLVALSQREQDHECPDFFIHAFVTIVKYDGGTIEVSFIDRFLEVQGVWWLLIIEEEGDALLLCQLFCHYLQNVSLDNVYTCFPVDFADPLSN